LHGILLDFFVLRVVLLVVLLVSVDLKVRGLWLGQVRRLQVVHGFLDLWLCEILHVLLINVSIGIDGLLVNASLKRDFDIRCALNNGRRRRQLVRV